MCVHIFTGSGFLKPRSPNGLALSFHHPQCEQGAIAQLFPSETRPLPTPSSGPLQPECRLQTCPQAQAQCKHLLHPPCRTSNLFKIWDKLFLSLEPLFPYLQNGDNHVHHSELLSRSVLGLKKVFPLWHMYCHCNYF